MLKFEKRIYLIIKTFLFVTFVTVLISRKQNVDRVVSRIFLLLLICIGMYFDYFL